MSIISFISPNKGIQSSLWPLLVRLSTFFTVVNFVSIFLVKVDVVWGREIIFLRPAIVLFIWFKDFVRESIIGFHSHKLEFSLRIAILLFILSEIFFFIRFFWAFFDRAIAPTVEYGLIWPPKGIDSIPFYSVPLLNTSILLVSGITVTWSHHRLIRNDFNNAALRLVATILLGAYFLVIQFDEYRESLFTIADGVYGSIFYIATGFHGIHVLIGTGFLTYIMYNIMSGKLLYNHHFSFEAAAWYWHFVDVVWLFLYLVVYIWFS